MWERWALVLESYLEYNLDKPGFIVIEDNIKFASDSAKWI